MLIAIFSLTVLGAVLGVVLGIANKVLRVEGNPVVDELIAMMPGSNCGQCGFPGCSGAATAIVDGTAPPTCCPPGGKSLAAAIAAKLGFSQPSVFSKFFRTLTKSQPWEWRIEKKKPGSNRKRTYHCYE